MFCPRCGTVLTVRSDERWGDILYCVRGDMALSRGMQEALERRYGTSDGGPQSPLSPYSPQIHGGLTWYCPGCGVRLDEHLQCPRCARHLRDLVYQLVELHPHRPYF
jgi:hypothetical protein